MSDPGILHHLARGIHPGAFVQPMTPNTADVQDGVLWLDTSAGPPYQLKRWDAGGAAWRVVQMDATGYPLPGGHRLDVVSRTAIEAETANFGTSGPDNYALEHVIPRGDLTLADFTGDLIVDWSMFAWDQVEDAGPYHIVVRLRRSELHGELLASHVFTAPTSQHPVFGVGLQNQYSWTAVYNDNAPTDGRYVITLQKLVHADIAMVNQDPYLRIRESVATTHRVRISHATLGTQMVWPIPAMSQQAKQILGKDTASGLPMWCAAPVVVAQYLTQPTGPSADASTCTTVKCGVAFTCTDHLNSLYSQWSRWLGPLFLLLGTVAAAALIEELGAMFLAEEALSAAPMIFGRLKPILQGLTGTIAGGLLPPLTSDQRMDVQKMLFCALSCEGDAVTPTVGAINAWHSALGAYGGWAVSSLQSELMQLLTEFTPLQDWLTAASSASPSTLCNAWTCP